MDLGVQLHISPVQDMIEAVSSVENDEDMPSRYKPKRTTGLWTSTWREDTQDSEWVEWCRGEDYSDPDGSHWFLLTPQSNSNLYVIDSYADLERLLAMYPYHSRYSPALDSHLAKYYTGIDFERMSKEYDGLHLTSEGNNRLHTSYPLNLNSWDCESTLWFRWCFHRVQRINTPKVMQEV